MPKFQSVDPDNVYNPGDHRIIVEVSSGCVDCGGNYYIAFEVLKSNGGMFSEMSPVGSWCEKCTLAEIEEKPLEFEDWVKQGEWADLSDIGPKEKGMRYPGSTYITRGDGGWHLTIANMQWTSTNLRELEERLHEYYTQVI